MAREDPTPVQKKVAAMESRMDASQYPQKWNTGLLCTCYAAPCYWVYTVLCPCCASYGMRRRALHGDMTRYSCCQGACPCSGHCNEQSCPTFCLTLEASLCFPESVIVTRFLIQDELRIQNTKCDNCLMAAQAAFAYCGLVCHCVACMTTIEECGSLAECFYWASECLYCAACACMQTQHRLQLDARDRSPVKTVGMAPPTQQRMQMNHSALLQLTSAEGSVGCGRTSSAAASVMSARLP